MFGKTDIQKPKIASRTLYVIPTGSQIGLSIINWFLIERRHSNLGISEIDHSQCCKKHPDPQEQKWILSQKRRWPATLSSEETLKEIKGNPQEK